MQCICNIILGIPIYIAIFCIVALVMKLLCFVVKINLGTKYVIIYRIVIVLVSLFFYAFVNYLFTNLQNGGSFWLNLSICCCCCYFVIFKFYI